MRKFQVVCTLAGACLQVTLASGASVAQTKDTIIIAIPGTPQGVDLDRQSGPQTWTMAAQVIELGAEWKPTTYPYAPTPGADPTKIPGFTYPDFRNQEMLPGIVKNCELNADGKTAVYHLREGVKSAAGNEFTAKDVLWRVERANALKAIGTFMQASVTANDPKQWQQVDDHTVRITSDKPMPLICSVLTNLYWYWYDSTEAKKHATPDDPWATKWASTSLVAFGPYVIRSWEAGNRVVMEANPNYWQGPPKIKRIIYQVVPESASRLALLKEGKVDLIEGVSPDEAVSLGSASNVRVAAVHGNQSIYLVMNNIKAPFDKVQVRQAINHLLPRDQIVKEIYRGLAITWEGVMPSVYPGYVEFHDYSYDVAEAKRLLAEAGYAGGFQTTLTYSAGDPVQENIAVLLKSQLSQVGITLDLRKQPVAAHSDLVQSKKADFALWIDFPIQPDPNYDLRLFYLTGNAVNYQNYSDKEVDRTLEEGASIVDTAERNAFHRPAQQIINKSATLGWIAEPHYVNAMSANLEGWKWFTTQYYKVGEMSFAK
jgi:peptide/nickel transport system substrate-binding protein